MPVSLPADPGVVKIGRVDRTTLLRRDGPYTISCYQNTRGLANLRMMRTFTATESAAHGTWIPLKDMEVDIFNGWGRKIFGGHILNVRVTHIVHGPEVWYDCECSDYTRILERFHVTAVYKDKLVGDIIRDIVGPDANTPGIELPSGSDATLDQEGVSIRVPAHVVDGPTVSAIFDHLTVLDAFERLVRDFSPKGYAIWMDAERGVHYGSLNPGEAPLAPFSIAKDTDTAVQGTISLEMPDSEYANHVLLRYSRKAVVPLVEEFTGDGISQAFTLTQPPADDPAPIVKVNAVDQTLNLKPEIDHPGAQWYWEPGDTIIQQAQLDPPLSTTDTLQVTYIPLFKDIVSVVNQAAINARGVIGGGSGRHQVLIERTDISDVEVARAMAESILDRVSQDAKRIHFSTYKPNQDYNQHLEPGMMMSVTIADFALNNASFMLDNVEIVMEESGALRYNCTGYGGSLLNNYVDFFRALGGGAGGNLGSGGVGDLDIATWHLRGTVITGDNSTNHHQFKRACKPLAVFISTWDTAPTGNFVFQLIHRETGKNVFNASGATLFAAEQKNSTQPVFNDPLPAFSKLDRAKLTVITPGGARDIVIKLFSR